MRIMPKTNIPYVNDILEIAVAFIVAWLFYQALSFAANTTMPIVSVVSGSMYHGTGFDEWWSRNENYYKNIGIEENEFREFVVPNGFTRGDLIFLVGDKNPKVGDVIIYQAPGRGNAADNNITIIHRVVEVRDNGIIVKGDNNPVADPIILKKNEIEGRAVFAVPLLGWPRLMLYAVGV